MSKEKKYRFYFSQKQSDIDEDVWDMPTRFVFVKTPNGYKQYSECCSLKGSKCNWSDAKLVYETNDEPEFITHEAIPELIADLEAKLDEKTRIAEGYCELFDKKQHENYEQFCEIQELKTKLAESEDRIAKARRQAYSSRQMDNTLKIRRLADEITAKEKAITKLKQQLAEKDLKIIELETKLNLKDKETNV